MLAKKIGSFIRNMLQRITLIAAQNQEDGDRFIELALRRSQLTVTGSLKFDISVTPELAARAVNMPPVGTTSASSDSDQYPRRRRNYLAGSPSPIIGAVPDIAAYSGATLPPRTLPESD